MREAIRRMMASAKTWLVWTGFLLYASAFAMSARTTGLVSMGMYIPFFALASLAIVGLCNGLRACGNKPTRIKCSFERQVGVMGGCATLIFFLSVLLWLGSERGVVLTSSSIILRQVNDSIMLLCASISIACWYQYSFGYATTSFCGDKDLRVLKMLCVPIIGAWMLELVLFLLQTIAMESIDGVRFIMGRLFGIVTVLLSAAVLKDRSDLQGRELPRGSRMFDSVNAPCAYYDVLRSLERVKLSDRELMVLSFTLLGESARSIGERLGVSAPTVGSYRQRGYRKMGVGSKKELTDLVLEYEDVDNRLASGAVVVEGACNGMTGRTNALPAPVDENSRISRMENATAKISMMAAAFCLVPLCLYGIVHFVLQVAFANDFLFYFGDPIKYWAIGILTISAAVLVACVSQKESPSFFSSIEANGPSIVGFIVVCVGVFCSAALVAESFYSITVGGVWGLIGLTAAFVCIGLSGEVSGIRGISLIRRAAKLACSGYPEVLLLFSSSIPLADAASSILFSISIDAYPLVTGSYRLGVAALAAYALMRLYSDVRNEELGPSKYEQLRHLLLGHGLTEPQTEVVIMSLRGQSAASICAKLLLAPGTVSSYRARAYAKLGVNGLNGLRKLIEAEMQSPCKKEENACSDG